MSDPCLHFGDADFSVDLPEPGHYSGTVTSARLRFSAQRNRMLQVTLTLHDVPPTYEQVSDYFVLEGASPRGVATSRRRLLELYHACGRYPHKGEAIAPADLLHASVEVEVDLDHYKGQPRLKVLGYRQPLSAPFLPHN